MDVSVVVPTLNEGDYIESCLSSVYSQETSFDFEVIVSDGGSDDRTIEIAEKFTDKIVVSREQGTAIQRNLGAGLAAADHLLFLDADTILMPGYLEWAHTKIRENPELRAFSAGFIFPERTPKLIFSERVLNSYFSVRTRLGRATLPGFNINIRRKVFEELGGFKDVPLEDIELSIQLRKLGPIKYYSDFFVITSSRRLERMGLLGSIKYYIEMDLTRKNPSLQRMLVYSDYFSCRVKNSDIQKTFERTFKAAGAQLTRDFSIKNYVNHRIETHSKIKTTNAKELFRETISTSKSIADLGFREGIEKIDIDSALNIIKEKIKTIKHMTRIKTK